jgi:hypothetical protein
MLKPRGRPRPHIGVPADDRHRVGRNDHSEGQHGRLVAGSREPGPRAIRGRPPVRPGPTG